MPGIVGCKSKLIPTVWKENHHNCAVESQSKTDHLKVDLCAYVCSMHAKPVSHACGMTLPTHTTNPAHYHHAC